MNGDMCVWCAGAVNCDPTTMFDCSRGAREKCVPLTSVCDKKDDCGDADDEAAELCVNHSESHLSPYQHPAFS